MPMLTIHLMVTEEVAAEHLAGSDMLLIPTPPDSLATLQQVVGHAAAVVVRTCEELEAVRAILADPAGEPAAMGATLARLALLAGGHATAAANLGHVQALLSAAVVAELGHRQNEGREVPQ